MNQIDGYINGKITPQPSAPTFEYIFYDFFNEFIVNDPEKAKEFISSIDGRNGYSKLKKLIFLLEKYTPDIDLKSYLKKCLMYGFNNANKKFEQNIKNKKAFEILTEGFCFAFQIYDKDTCKEIKADLTERIVNCIAELTFLTKIQHGEKFKSAREKGSLSKKTIFIKELIEKNPLLSAKALYKLAGEDNFMKFQTFKNKVSKIKKSRSLKQNKSKNHDLAIP